MCVQLSLTYVLTLHEFVQELNLYGYEDDEEEEVETIAVAEGLCAVETIAVAEGLCATVGCRPTAV